MYERSSVATRRNRATSNRGILMLSCASSTGFDRDRGASNPFGKFDKLRDFVVAQRIVDGWVLRGKGWWARQDSNLQQHGYEPWVLTN